MPQRRETISIPGHQWMIQITDDQSRTLVARDSAVAYHSASGAATETRHVYLSNSGVLGRLESGIPTSVLEVGFGTGLGMLMTLDAAVAFGTPLRFSSLEHHLLGCDVLSSLNLERQLCEPALLESFLDFRASLGAVVAPGRYRWQVGDGNEVWLICGDATTLDFPCDDLVDAIYFDPFAPSENPELWQTCFLRNMRAAIKLDGRLVTYCVSRMVRERFVEAGFDVYRVRGPKGGKREVLIASPRP